MPSDKYSFPLTSIFFFLKVKSLLLSILGSMWMACGLLSAPVSFRVEVTSLLSPTVFWYQWEERPCDLDMGKHRGEQLAQGYGAAAHRYTHLPPDFFKEKETKACLNPADYFYILSQDSLQLYWTLDHVTRHKIQWDNFIHIVRGSLPYSQICLKVCHFKRYLQSSIRNKA